MIRNISLLLAIMTAAFGLAACGVTPEKKPVGPGTQTSSIPWNSPIAGQGQGQLGMLPQNQYRR